MEKGGIHDCMIRGGSPKRKLRDRSRLGRWTKHKKPSSGVPKRPPWPNNSNTSVCTGRKQEIKFQPSRWQERIQQLFYLRRGRSREKKIQISKHRQPKPRIDPGGRHGRLLKTCESTGISAGRKAQVITGSKGPQKQRSRDGGNAAEMVYRVMSQFGRRLDIKSSLVPTVSAGSRLIR